MKKDNEYPNTTVSDENDRNPRYVRYLDALENGWIRRITEIFVVDTENHKVLLQKRSTHVHVSPNSWTTSVGEGVDEGEEYEDAAKRGLGEELGLPALQLRSLGKVYAETPRDHTPGASITKTWSKVFAVQYDGSPISYKEDEIGGIEWFTIDKIDQMLEVDPHTFAMRFPKTWSEIREKLVDFIEEGSK